MNAKSRIFGSSLLLWSPLMLASVLLSLVNTYMLMLLSINKQDCVSTVQKSIQFEILKNEFVSDDFLPIFKDNEGHWDVRQKDDEYKISFQGDFEWTEEFNRVMSVVPVLHHEPSIAFDKTMHQTFRILYPKPIMWYKMGPVSTVLPTIPKNLNPNKITEKLRTLSQAKSTRSFPDYILNCQELSDIEKSKDFPKLNYYSRSATRWRGNLKFSDEHEVKVIQKRFSLSAINNKFIGGNEGENGEFELAKRELFNLLSVQGWYGMPRLYAVCVINSKFQDVGSRFLQDNLPEDQLHMIRFVISEYNEDVDSIPFCIDGGPMEDCIKAQKLYYRLRSRGRPPVAAIQVMLNTAKLFQNIFLQRAYLDGISGQHIVMSQNFDIKMSDVTSLIMLSGDEHNFRANHSRLLSGTICKYDRDCPSPTWYTTIFGSAVSALCGEIRGMCSTVGLCHGVDIHAYVCVFSRWIFSILSDLVPNNWENKIELIRIVKCGSDPLPDKRCTWKQMMEAFDDLLKKASIKWPEEEDGEEE